MGIWVNITMMLQWLPVLGNSFSCFRKQRGYIVKAGYNPTTGKDTKKQPGPPLPSHLIPRADIKTFLWLLNSPPSIALGFLPF